MRLKCPACRTLAGADSWAAEVDVEAVMKIGFDLPSEVSRRMLAYLALFRPVSGRPMAWSTTRTHAEVLQELVGYGIIEWDKRAPRPNNITAWANAMEKMIQNPPRHLPLKNHNYLRKMAYEIADDMDRTVEVAHNRAERNGTLRRQKREERNTKENGRGTRKDLEKIPIPTREEVAALRKRKKRV